MVDYLAWRGKFGVTTPSTNTVVQPEYDTMRPPGITNHLGRMHIPNIEINSNETFDESIRLIDAGLDEAIDRVMTCNPDYLVLGISALAIWGGSVQYGEDLKKRMVQRAGRDIGVATAADAVPAALKAHGIKKRIAIMEPYFPSIEPRLRGLFGEHGYEIMRFKHFLGASPATYSHVSDTDMISALREIDGDDVEALVQFGANLPMSRIADEAERWLGKPVISINVATYWYALRQHGINDQFRGFTRLFSQF